MPIRRMQALGDIEIGVYPNIIDGTMLAKIKGNVDTNTTHRENTEHIAAHIVRFEPFPLD